MPTRSGHRRHGAGGADPFAIDLVTDPSGNARLAVADSQAPRDDLPDTSLAERIRKLLAAPDRPMTRAAIRALLRVNNKKLGDVLAQLRHQPVLRGPDGWRLRSRQLHL